MLALIATLLAQSCDAPFVCIDGNQVVNDSKVFTGLVQAYGEYSSGGEQVSLIVIKGLRVGGQISPALDGNSLVLRGRREMYDSAAGVIIYNEHALDAGGYLSVETPNGQTLVSDWQGNLILNAALNSNGTQASDVLHRGMIVHANQASG